MRQKVFWQNAAQLAEGRDCFARKVADSIRANKFPTGAMASFRFRGAWKALEPHGAELFSFITPMTLAGLGVSDTSESGA